MRWWRRKSLPLQYTIGGGAIIFVAAMVTGNWVAERFQVGVVRTAAATSSLHLQSILLPGIRDAISFGTISPPAQQALSEAVSGEDADPHILGLQLSLDPGSLLPVYGYANDAPEAQSFALSKAWEGELLSTVLRAPAVPPADADGPVIEVYAPVIQSWTGEVIAVLRFYETSPILDARVSTVRREAWIAISSTFLGAGALIMGLIWTGGMALTRQNAARKRQLRETLRLLAVNEELRRRLISFSAAENAQNDRIKREVGIELHDGPIQYIAMARMRLDSATENGPGSVEAAAVDQSLGKAINELRHISRGLSVPDLEVTPLPNLILRVCKDTQDHAGIEVDLYCADALTQEVGYSRKLCSYRFLQETLANVAKHSGADQCRVDVAMEEGVLHISVEDEGVGFAGLESRRIRSDGGQGLFNLTERAESLGGRVEVHSIPGEGTRFDLFLPLID